MDVLLDVNVAVDICTGRQPFFRQAALAAAKCLLEGSRLWIYVGSVQILEYVTRDELRRTCLREGKPITNRQLERLTRDLLKVFCNDKHWLAALANEGSVFESPDPEHEQLIRALRRFVPGAMKLLTRDESVCLRHPDLTITPQQYLIETLKPKAMDFIDLKAEQDGIRPRLQENSHRVLHHRDYSIGREAKELEIRLADYAGTEHCITVASGAEALLISLMALGIGPGDEVITTPFTFIATVEAIAMLGARPVFVDIEPDTCHIDAAQIEAKITANTKAILPVSLYGQPADMDAINTIAERHGLPVIEEAAHSFGAEYRGKKSCNLSTIGCTSFIPGKPLGCYGESGAIFTRDPALAAACREIHAHGQSRYFEHTRTIVGRRMDPMQCAIVLAKLDGFRARVAKLIEIGARYNALMDEARIRRVQQRLDRTSVFPQYTILVDDRETVQSRLRDAGISTPVEPPAPLNHRSTFQRMCPSDRTPNAREVAKRVVNVPMHPWLSESDLSRIVRVLVDSHDEPLVPKQRNR